MLWVLCFLLFKNLVFGQSIYIANITDSLLAVNKVKSRTKLDNGIYISEKSFYDKEGRESKKIHYFHAAKESIPNMITDFFYDSLNKLVYVKDSVVNEFRNGLASINMFGQNITDTKIYYKYDETNRLSKVVFIDSLQNRHRTTLHADFYEYGVDRKLIKQTKRDSLGNVCIETLYTYHPLCIKEIAYFNGKVKREFETVFEKPNIPSKITITEREKDGTSSNTIATYINRYDKRGQLIKTIASGNDYSYVYYHQYYNNGLLATVKGEKDYILVYTYLYDYY